MKNLFITLLLVATCISPKLLAKEKVYTKLKITEKEKNKRLSILIKKEEKLIRSLKTRGPRLWWRLVELQSEKLKIIKKRENEAFIKGSINNPNITKSAYFKESKSLVKKIFNEGMNTIKRWPDFYNVGDIYYTLALNNRDFGDRKKVQNLLILSEKTSKHNKKLTYKIKVALAEHYYNEKKYKLANRYYKSIINNTKNPWIAKHLYNYSWCLTKVNQYDKAIRFGRLALELGKQKGFASVEEQVLSNMGLFHILAKNIEGGVKFYIEEVKKPTSYLIRMAKKTATDISYEKAKYIYDQALSFTLKNSQINDTMLIYLEQLDFYRSFKKDMLFTNTSLAIESHFKTNIVKKEHKERAVTAIKSYTNYLQIHFRNSIERYQIASTKYKHIIRFMDILVTIDKNNSDFYHFYQAEVFLALQKVTQSLDYYKKSLVSNIEVLRTRTKKEPKIILNKDEKNKHYDHRVKIFDSIFFALSSDTLSKETKAKYTVYSYNQHISLFPKANRTKEIFPKLFHHYFVKKDINQSQKTLDKFIVFFPKSMAIQRKLNTLLIDYHITHKNIEKLMPSVVKIEKGFLKYKPKYIKNALHILSNIIFTKYEEMAKSGREDEALKGYEKLFENKKTPKSLKGNAAFKIALLNLNNKKYILGTKWLKQSYPLIPIEDRHKIAPQIQNISNQLFLEQQFVQASNVASSFTLTQCKLNYDIKDNLFSFWLTTELLRHKTNRAHSILKIMKKCNIKKKTYEASFKQLAKHIFDYHNTKTYISFYKKYKNKPSFHKNSMLRLEKRYWQAFLKNHKKTAASLLLILKKYNKNPQINEIISFNNIINNTDKLNIKKMSHFSNDSKFKEDAFNKTLEYNMTKLSELRSILKPYLNSSHPQLSLTSFKFLSDYISSFAKEIDSVVPHGFGKDYQNGFKGAMKQIVIQFTNDSNNLEREIKKVIVKSHQFPRKSKINIKLLSSKSYYNKVGYRHPASYYILPVDQGRP